MTTSNDDIRPYLSDASAITGGVADEVLFPRTEEELAAIVADRIGRGIPITVAGGGTGLVGGRVPFGGTVISTARMDRIGELDTVRSTVDVEPGVPLFRIHAWAAERNLLYPPDPTETGGFIGGNIATNASGARTFRYGPTRSWITALRVVLASGEILDLHRGDVDVVDRTAHLRAESGRTIDLSLPEIWRPDVRKNAAGYYLAPGMDGLDLFIGSEGTLGVVTRATLRLVPAPEKLFSGIVFFADEERMLDFVDEVRERSLANRGEAGHLDAIGIEGRIDSRAIEFIDANALKAVRHLHPTIPTDADGGAIWFEQECTAENETVLLEAWYDVIERHTPLMDASWFGIEEQDHARMRAFRHTIPSTAFEIYTSRRMRKFGTDMAVPVDRFREMFRFYREGLTASGLEHMTWGHIGDAHLHVNLLPRDAAEAEVAAELFDRFIAEAIALGGTVSAEHGIGKLKRNYLREMYGDEIIRVMRRIKRSLDPSGLLGKGTMFEDEEISSAVGRV